VEVDGVAHVKHELELTMGEHHVGHESVGLVADLSLPLRTVEPAEPTVGEHPESARMADGVVLLAEVREIDVAESIDGVEHHLQRAVADHGARFGAPIYRSRRRLTIGIARAGAELNHSPFQCAAPSLARLPGADARDAGVVEPLAWSSSV
jgi:hypothetical protein